MEKAIYFLAAYNPQIIQAGFAVVLLLIIVYVYRVFFMATDSTVDSADFNHSPAIEQKLNQILEQQKSKSTGGAATNSTSTARSHNAEEEIDKLKAEIYNLRQQLNETEKKVFDGGSATSEQFAGVSSGSRTSSDNGGAGAISEAAHEEFVVKVKELESRLAEYEIIADDIAELSQLRADNARLKEQLSNFQPEGSSDKKTKNIPPPEMMAQAIDATTAADAKKAVSTDELSGQALVDALFAEVGSSDVPVAEQNMLNEFEEKIEKKEDT